MKIKHLKCNYTQDFIPISSNAHNIECKLCLSKNEINNIEDAIAKVYELEGDNYSVICEFNIESIKMKIKHNNCGKEMKFSLMDFINRGRRCTNPKCSKRSNKYNFKDLVRERFGGEYIVIGEYKHSEKAVEIKHNTPDCGRITPRIPKHFLYGKAPCPYCKKINSKGEARIKRFLKKNKIVYKSEYSFKNCRDIGSLRFDFAIFDRYENLLCLVEYDGIHHFEPTDFSGRGKENAKREFDEIVYRDFIKNKFCKENDIPLHRIPYWEFDNIEKQLKSVIKEYYF